MQNSKEIQRVLQIYQDLSGYQAVQIQEFAGLGLSCCTCHVLPTKSTTSMQGFKPKEIRSSLISKPDMDLHTSALLGCIFNLLHAAIKLNLRLGQPDLVLTE